MAVGVEPLKLHGFFQKIKFPKKYTFFGDSSQGAHRVYAVLDGTFELSNETAVSGFLKF